MTFYYSYKPDENDSGSVYLFRKAGTGEKQGKVTLAQLVHGKNSELYEVVDGVFTAKSNVSKDAIIASQAALIEAAATKIEAIETARETAGLKSVTIEEANQYIENQFSLSVLDAALSALNQAPITAEIKAPLASVLLELRQLHIKAKQAHLAELPYILEDK